MDHNQIPPPPPGYEGPPRYAPLAQGPPAYDDAPGYTPQGQVSIEQKSTPPPANTVLPTDPSTEVLHAMI